jgi:hypothetical protein
MKMSLNWQAIINFILFAMIVVAFVFSIWSYVKTNNIKNTNSPSVKKKLLGSNTYVNDIPSSPGLIYLPITGLNSTYAAEYFMNGSTILLTSDAPTSVLFTNTYPRSDAPGFYFKIVNANPVDSIDIQSDISNPVGTIFTLAAGESAYFYDFITNLNGSPVQGWTKII